MILASASPRRAQLFEQIGLAFRIVRPDVDETPGADETPEAYVRRLAAEKAAAVLAALHEPEAVIVAADTVVTCAGEILGKP
ncbi:MAG: Maf family protein, partial [Proteobacteria bacterium]|nr:Maf family protein [Pseudomonadota bacterium]